MFSACCFDALQCPDGFFDSTVEFHVAKKFDCQFDCRKCIATVQRWSHVELGGASLTV